MANFPAVPWTCGPALAVGIVKVSASLTIDAGIVGPPYEPVVAPLTARRAGAVLRQFVIATDDQVWFGQVVVVIHGKLLSGYPPRRQAGRQDWLRGTFRIPCPPDSDPCRSCFAAHIRTSPSSSTST